MTANHITNSKTSFDNHSWIENQAVVSCPVRRSDVTEEFIDDQAVLFDPKTGSTYRLNSTALEVWRNCESGNNIIEVVEVISRKYEVGIDRVQDDVEQLVAFFAAHGLVIPDGQRNDLSVITTINNQSAQ